MSTIPELRQIAALAYLTTETPHLFEDVTAIMTYVDQLRQVDTSQVQPLFHPLDLHQRLRADKVTETDQTAALAQMAPLMDDGLYLVTKVIDGK